MTSASKNLFSVLSTVNDQQNDQMMPIPGKEMVKNNAGGYGFKVSDEQFVTRLLVLGTGANYYKPNHEATLDSFNGLNELLVKNPDMVLDTISKVYESGSAPKIDYQLMALAVASCSKDQSVRTKALALVEKLRILSHAYSWKGYQKTISGTKGFGRAVKRSINKMLVNMSPMKFAYQVTKYQQRKVGDESWAILDLLRCCHPNPNSLTHESQVVLRYVTKGAEKAFELANEFGIQNSPVVQYLQAVNDVKKLEKTVEVQVEPLTEIADSTSLVNQVYSALYNMSFSNVTPVHENKPVHNTEKICELIYTHNLPREVLPTWALNDINVWKALLVSKDLTNIKMPLTALIRNLGQMTSKQIFSGDNGLLIAKMVASKLIDYTSLKRAKIHPVQLLIANKMYKNGHGDKGSLTWSPLECISKALWDGFYVAAGATKPTGKRIFHAIDCSGSMTSPIPSCPLLTSMEAAAVMALTYSRCEDESTQSFALFTSGKGGSYSCRSSGLLPVKISKNASLEEVSRIVQRADWGGTDCSLPVVEAMNLYKSSNGNLGKYDAFMIYTDNDTWAGQKHVSQVIKEYRQLTGIPAKVVVVATLASNTTVADPSDGGMFDVTGFDTNAPPIVNQFITGNIIENNGPDEE
jgi:60 kDa SS-A/Ro ribonucleoprotein